MANHQHDPHSSTLTSSSSSSPSSSPPPPTTTTLSLTRLSSNLSRLLLPDPDFDSSDALILIPPHPPIPVHRCILAARSPFFHSLFSQAAAAAAAPKPRYRLRDLLPRGAHVGHEAFSLLLAYLYTGKLNPSPPDASQCADLMCAHDACRPAIDFTVELAFAASLLQLPDLLSLFQRRLLNFVEKAFVEDVIPILSVAFHSQLNQLLASCVQRIARSNLDDITLDKELPKEAADEVRTIRRKAQPDKSDEEMSDPAHEKRVGRIHRALDSDDVELVKLLLTESSVTLDDANALHYAAEYCDSKVVVEVLDMGLASVNLRNARGYTPLHVAAMRRELAVILSLLEKGASVSETTADGQNAVSICRRLTRAKDYYMKKEEGRESNKDRLCIEVLEREMRRNPIAVEDSVTSPLLADDLHMKLQYLENRVSFARLFFPTEAKLAMELANAEITTVFPVLPTSRSSGNLREVDLNETPTMQNRRLRSRVDALTRTVELGRRYFPNCTEVVDKFLEHDQPDRFYLQKGTPEEQKIKRMRFCELKVDVQKAFTKDKAENGCLGQLSSVSSPPLRGEVKQNNTARK